MHAAHPGEPAPPFSAWPVQSYDPNVGFGWYVAGATLVTQIVGTRGTPRVADVLGDWIDQALADHQREVADASGLLLIHDWRRVTTYDTEARQLWLQRMKQRAERHPRYLRKAVVVVADNPLLKMAVAGANLLAAMTSGAKGSVELSTSLHEVLRKYGVRPPAG